MWSGAAVTFIGAALLAAAAAAPERLTVDTHLHVTMSQAASPIFKGEPGSGVLTWSPRNVLLNQIDADQLLAAHEQVAVAALWPSFRLRPGRRAIDEALHQLEGLREFCRRQPQFAMVKSAAEAREVVAHGRIALIPAIEGGEGLDSVGDVDRLYAAGARSVTLMHFADTQLGGAASGQLAYNLFKQLGVAPNPRGLSELGHAVVTRMLQLGMLVDLAHASDETSTEVLDEAEKYGSLVINSHGGARAFLPMERNISDALAARIAKLGGTVGVTSSQVQAAQVPEAAKWEGYVVGSCDDVVAHWKHLAEQVPPEQLTFGSDFNGFVKRSAAGGSCEHGVRNTGDQPALYSALVAHGVPAQAIDRMGWRFLEVWEAVEKKADPTARDEARDAKKRPSSPFDVAM
ncbi:MAG: membrane dipeptidase [Archangiaceae bacterium]|nr:membrane dipeptidase [Archangiaceae bacterium]